MIIENGKIVECTDAELFDYWLKRFDDAIPYESFKYGCTANGVRIVEEDEAHDK